MKAHELLAAIGCITEVNNIDEYVYDVTEYPNGHYEAYFKLYAEDGKAVIGTIDNWTNFTAMSKLDYINNMKFNRNVNLRVALQ